MAVTGTGTQADPFIVHSYSEFISLSAHSPVDNGWTYIKWFDTPNQVLDCNEYGSEFKWDTFSAYGGNYTAKGIDIDLNGCTIKNLIIADGKAMFNGHFDSANSRKHQLRVHDGSIRNVFLGSATSRFVDGAYVEFSNVSISVNMMGSTVPMFNNDQEINNSLLMDNCALYLVASTLSTFIFNQIVMTDTDIELHITDQNNKPIFEGTFSDSTRQSKITDCRIQGKIGGKGFKNNYTNARVVLGALNSGDMYANNAAIFTNCVIDVDLTDSEMNHILYTTDGGVSINTNVICISHVPNGYVAPSAPNYLSHSDMRSYSALTNAGFTVVEVVDGD